jgi:signal transduction histidine kinase
MITWPKTVSRSLMTGTIAVAGVLILLAMTVVIVIYQEQTYRAQKLQEVVAQSDVLAASVTAALVFNDSKAAQEYVSALSAYPSLEIAAVYDAAGHLVASITRPNGGAPPADVTIGAPYFAEDHIVVTKPVRQNGQVVGKVYLRVAVDSAPQRVVRYSGILMLVTMAVLMLTILGGMQQTLTKTNARLKNEIAERAKVEEALRQSHKMEALGQLAGGVAHDFNNLLAIIKSSLQLMQRRLGPAKADVQRFIDAAMDGVDRAASVTQRVLAFSRRQELAQQPTNLTTLIGGMLDLIRQSVGSAVQIETSLASDWFTICDQNQMENVVLNLAVNARDAMPSGGKITIETADVRLTQSRSDVPPGEYICMVLRDTGTGMPEEVRRKAFDPFFTTKPHGKGTGLGLSMTFGYVRQSNGYIEIESELGKGTSVTLFMPRATNIQRAIV